jgi:iron complex outermembrane receptor protein
MWSAATRAVGDYHTADLRVGWRPSAQLEISVAGQNLLQPHHLEFRHEPGPPVGISRSASVRVTWTRPGR